jgi:c-di-GMP-binding flagellar brake protein YcgR
MGQNETSSEAAKLFAGRRQHPRAALVREVEYEAESRKFYGRLIEISVGGMLVETHHVLTPSTIITVRFSLGREPIVTTAEVIYHREKRGMGVRFLDYSFKGDCFHG